MQHLREGDVFANRFEILRALGSGGYAIVYEAIDRTLGRRVALKVMKTLTSGNDGAGYEESKRHAREVAALKCLKHPHIVQYLEESLNMDAGGSDSAPWMTMEVLDGKSLHNLIRTKAPFPTADIVEIMHQVCDGLAAAHEILPQPIIHRDLKPANIFVEYSAPSQYRVKIIDWNLAYFISSTMAPPTTALGTREYAPPEQSARNGAEPNVTWDVWPLGLIVFEMLTGKYFWTERAHAFSLVAKGVTASARARELGVAKYIPTGFDGWFSQCVAVKANERYPDVKTAYRALEAILVPGRAVDAIRAEVFALSEQLSSLTTAVRVVQNETSKEAASLRTETTASLKELTSAVDQNVAGIKAELKTEIDKISKYARIVRKDLVKVAGDLEAESAARQERDRVIDEHHANISAKGIIKSVESLELPSKSDSSTNLVSEMSPTLTTSSSQYEWYTFRNMILAFTGLSAIGGIVFVGYSLLKNIDMVESSPQGSTAAWLDAAFCRNQLDAWPKSPGTKEHADAGTLEPVVAAYLRANIVDDDTIVLSCPPLNSGESRVIFDDGGVDSSTHVDAGNLYRYEGGLTERQIKVNVDKRSKTRPSLFGHLSTYANPMIHVHLRIAPEQMSLDAWFGTSNNGEKGPPCARLAWHPDAAQKSEEYEVKLYLENRVPTDGWYWLYANCEFAKYKYEKINFRASNMRITKVDDFIQWTVPKKSSDNKSHKSKVKILQHYENNGSRWFEIEEWEPM